MKIRQNSSRLIPFEVSFASHQYRSTDKAIIWWFLCITGPLCYVIHEILKKKNNSWSNIFSQLLHSPTWSLDLSYLNFITCWHFTNGKKITLVSNFCMIWSLNDNHLFGGGRGYGHDMMTKSIEHWWFEKYPSKQFCSRFHFQVNNTDQLIKQ